MSSMATDFDALKQRATVVAQSFREYIQAKYDFLAVAQACSVRGWPDRKAQVENAWRLQVLFSRREELRLEFLFKRRAHEIGIFKSVSEISSRLAEHWSANDEAEADAVGTRSEYSDVLHEIEILQANLDSEVLAGPFQDVQRDPDYLFARSRLQDKLQLVEAKLG